MLSTWFNHLRMTSPPGRVSHFLSLKSLLRKNIRNCWQARSWLKGERKNRKGKCLKWWVESQSLVILCGSGAFCLGDASFQHISILQHALQVSWLHFVDVRKRRGIKEIEATMFDRRGWGQEACKWVNKARGSKDSKGDWRKGAWGSKSSLCRS